MKNKLFVLLWVAYVAVVFFILQLNQVFTLGVERTSMEKLNIAINLGFLLFIGILFVVSTISFVNLNNATTALSKVTNIIQREDKDSYDNNGSAIWHTINSSKNLFNNHLLDKSMSEYREQLRKKGNSFSSTKYVPIDDFINEALLEKAGMSYFNSAMPGTLTGLGILGTFIGLSLGLASFSGNDIYTISDNVGPLLSGMKVAFHTSVYGILFSLVFTFVYRSLMSDAFEKLDRFLTTFKHYTNQSIQDSEASASMLVYQANTAALLKEILSYLQGTSEEQTEAMGQVVDRFCQQMQYSLGTDFSALGNSLRDTNANLAGSTEVLRGLSETTSDLVQSNIQMANTIAAIAKEQKEIETRLIRQERKLDGVCDDISARLYTFDAMNK